MLTAYPTRSLRHSKGNFGKWMLGLPLIAIAAGVIITGGNRGDIRAMTSFVRDVPGIFEPSLERRSERIHRAPSFQIGGPAAAGIAVLMNDSPELRTRAEQARIKHASERFADDTGRGR